jgi:hypothetical protein
MRAEGLERGEMYERYENIQERERGSGLRGEEVIKRAERSGTRK